jgi:hypothetical protein
MPAADLLFLFGGVAILLLVNFFGVRMWLGRTDRTLMFDLSHNWMFWTKGGRGSLLVLGWLALGLDLIAVALILKWEGLVFAMQFALWPAYAAIALYLSLCMTGRPRWAMPPWFRRGLHPDHLSDSSPAHLVTVNYVADAQHGTAPYFVALCSCGNVGEVFSVGYDLASVCSASFADARAHSEHVQHRVSAPLDPMPR